MLYERWRHIVQEQRSEFALHDSATGRRWTFAQLDSAAEAGGNDREPVAFPEGAGSEFVLAVLRAWKSGQIVCPLEVQQQPPVLSDTPAGSIHLKTTSATTGAARLVAFTDSQLTADVENIVATMGLRPDWPNVGVISLAHSYGFSNLVLPLLLKGIPLIIPGSQLPEAVRQALQGFSEVTLPAVPALWRAWHDAAAITPNIRLAISAGAPLPMGLEQDVFSKTGLKIHNFYGATECGGIAYDATAAPRSDGACVGSPLKNVDLSLNPDGCLQVRSQAVGETYWPERRANLAGGCYQTSDLAELSNGRIFLRGRAGDLINVAGRKVSPDVIERVLQSHPAVRDCLVFGVPNAESSRGDVIVGCVALQTAGAGNDLRQWAVSHLPTWQVPREWWFVDNLSTNERGKLPRAEWRRKYLESKRANS